MRKNRVNIIYAVVGIILCTAVIATRSEGSGKTEQRAYEAYLEESGRLSELGFTGFVPKETKVRFFDGENDLVADTSGEWKKEKPVLNVLAGSIWQVGDEYQVLVPVYEKMNGLLEVMDDLQKVQGEAWEPRSIYSEEMYTATICHEAFHCWQMGRFEDQILNRAYSYDGDRERIISEEIDNVPEMAASVEREAKLYRKAYFTEDQGEKKALAAEALRESAGRREKLSTNAGRVEYYVETLEGSAMYVEAMAYRDLTSEEEFEKQYLGEFVYSGGSSKYYTIGMYRCLLLDQLGTGWQAEFNYVCSPSILLEKVLE